MKITVFNGLDFDVYVNFENILPDKTKTFETNKLFYKNNTIYLKSNLYSSHIHVTTADIEPNNINPIFFCDKKPTNVTLTEHRTKNEKTTKD
tara:strand:+ start:163 stop:438 length:276 start_codon:yes stop_codon:yes gene_type:complete